MLTHVCPNAGKHGLMSQVASRCGWACRASFVGGGLAVAAGSLALPQRHYASTEQHSQRTLYRALVVGPTGATGSKVVEELAFSDAWQVTAVSRRPLKNLKATNLETVVVGAGSQKYIYKIISCFFFFYLEYSFSCRALLNPPCAETDLSKW